MIDAALTPLLRRALDGPARWLAGRGVSADQITLAGFGAGLLAIPCIIAGAYTAGLGFILLNRLMDGLDGAVARISGASDRGAFLDIALDFMFYALIPLAFAFAEPEANALPAALLITAFIGTGSSFLAFSTIAAKRGLKAESFPKKGIYYLGGLTEGAETIALFIVMCLFPACFPWLATAFAAACAITTLLRWRQGWVAFKDE